jgi:hypothetical protein
MFLAEIRLVQITEHSPPPKYEVFESKGIGCPCTAATFVHRLQDRKG